METKFDLHLCANYDNKKLKSAICNCLLTDFVIEKIRCAIKKYNKEDVDFFYIYEDFKNTIEKNNAITFADIDSWEKHKISVYQDCFNLLVNLDGVLSNANLIESGSLIEQISLECQDYLVLLNLCEIDCKKVDLGLVDLRQEYIDNLKSQLAIVDEGQFLSDLVNMRIEVVPIENAKFRHKYIEQKLDKAQRVANAVRTTLQNEFDKLHDDVMSCYDKFYKISYSSASDGEKASAAKNVSKILVSHRKILDKLENKLTEANELKRQLFVNEKKIRSEFDVRLTEFDNMTQERPSEKYEITIEKDGYKYVNNEYLQRINATIDLVSEVAQEISDRYDMLDRIEASLQSAIPSESEMKRYTALSFKYDDLHTRLELARSQIKNKDKDFDVAIKGAMVGLKVLSHLSKECKELFIRNSLLSMVFNCVNGIYDLVDTKNKSLELSQVKYVTSRLVKYSLLNSNFMTDLKTFRHISNNTIRDVAIMMGRPFNLQTMIDIVESIELSISQLEGLIETLNSEEFPTQAFSPQSGDTDLRPFRVRRDNP